MAKRVSKRVLAVFMVFAITAAIFPFIGIKASAAISAPKSVAVIEDYDNCLTEAQEEELMKSLTVAANSAGCYVGIVITSDLNGVSSKEYANAFSDYHFNRESDAVVLLLFNSYDKPEYANATDYISTGGKMISKLDKYINPMFNSIYDKMGEPQGDPYAFNQETGTYGGYDYYAACEAFADSIVIYAGSFSLDDEGVDPGFSGGGIEGTKARLLAEALAEFFAGILRMLGGLRLA